MNIIISGASGKMGLAIARIAATKGHSVVAGLDKNEGNLGYPVYSDYSKCTQKADCVIDFSHPSALHGVLDFCVSKGLPVVIGTTGFSAEQQSEMQLASKKIPVLHSSNMSTGVKFLHKLVKLAAAELSASYDIEIVEAHHNQKVDAPSGTAAALFNSIKSVVPDAEPMYDRHAVSQKRAKNEVGIQAIRGGAIVGDHDVIFVSTEDKITISHSAFSRDIFASGAVDAANFLVSMSAGMYTINDF